MSMVLGVGGKTGERRSPKINPSFLFSSTFSPLPFPICRPVPHSSPPLPSHACSVSNSISLLFPSLLLFLPSRLPYTSSRFSSTPQPTLLPSPHFHLTSYPPAHATSP